MALLPGTEFSIKDVRAGDKVTYQNTITVSSVDVSDGVLRFSSEAGGRTVRVAKPTYGWGNGYTVNKITAIDRKLADIVVKPGEVWQSGIDRYMVVRNGSLNVIYKSSTDTVVPMSKFLALPNLVKLLNA